MLRFAARFTPFSKGEKLLFGFLPFAIAGFALSALWIRRADDVPQLAFPIPAPLPNPNGFDFYVAAARAMTPAKPSVDPIDDRRPLLTTNPQLAAINYSLARRTAWLSTNANAFALVQQGLATPSRFDPATGFGAFAPLRQLARSKVIEANTLIIQKQWNAATHSSLDTIQMGYDIARGGPLMSKLVGSAVTAIGRDPLFTDRQVPERLTAPQARIAARRLEAILATRPSWKDAIEAGKWEVLGEFLSTVERGNWRALATQNNPQMSWRERLSIQFLAPGEVMQRISQEFDQSVANIRKPYSASIPPAPPPDPITAMFSYQSDYRFQEGREIVPFNTLLLRFALRAYRLENGGFPDSLGALAPRYLKRIPSDYFASGAPFRYRKRGQNYDLWSVGPDKKDDGGVPIKSRSGQVGVNAAGRFPSILPDSTGDYVAGKNR